MNFDFSELTECLERSYSQRVALRPVALCDAWPLFLATRNPAFNKYLLWPQPEHEDLVLKRIRLIMDAARVGRLCAVSAVQRQTGEFIALFRFQPYAARADAIEMGIWVHDKYWHGRYSLELGRLCVSAAFTMSNIQLLLGASSPENRGSCHLMKAVGMSPGQLVPRDTEMGYSATLQEFTISRPEWASRHVSPFSVYDPQRSASPPAEKVCEPHHAEEALAVE
jgi:RimJ/RimL family protein N-acetyltransferase